MTTEVKTVNEQMKGLVTYSVTQAAIAKFKEDFMPLVIKDASDKEGYQAVVVAARTIREKRIDVENRRKELKRDSLEFGRFVDTEAKKISDPLEEIEAHLKSEKERIDLEIAERKIREEREAKMPERVAKLEEMGETIDEKKKELLLTLDDNQFDNLVLGIERNKLRKEQEALAEAKRKEQEAQEATKKEQEAEAKRLEDERKKLEQEKADLEAAKQAEADRIEAEAKAKEEAERLAEEARIAEEKRLADEKIAAEAAAKAEKERLEKEKKYKDFLAKNGYNEETRGDYLLQRDENVITLYKKVDSITV